MKNKDLINKLEAYSIKKILVDVLLDHKNDSGQKTFFKQIDIEEFNITLDGLFYLIRQEKPLYQRWTQKTDNKERQLSVPKKPLRNFIENYVVGFIKRKGVHDKCHGGEVGWSVKKSLETHLPCSSSLSFDLKSAFENVPFRHVYDLFYGLLDNHFSNDIRKDIANFFSVICTVAYSEKRGLPQGSPCSMALFNRILYPLDEILNKKAKERRLTYSRWVDDLTISSSAKIEQEYFLGAVELIEKHFPVSREKIFFQNSDLIYLLGHRISGNSISKNTKEERLRNKTPPLNFEEWFGSYSQKNYKSWID